VSRSLSDSPNQEDSHCSESAQSSVTCALAAETEKAAMLNTTTAIHFIILSVFAKEIFMILPLGISWFIVAILYETALLTTLETALEGPCKRY